MSNIPLSKSLSMAVMLCIDSTAFVVTTTDPRGTVGLDSYATTVTCAMRDPELGLTHYMPITNIRDEMKDPGELPDDPNKLADAVRQEARDILDKFTQTLRDQFLDPNKDPLRVLNASNGATPAEIAKTLFQRIQEDPDKSKNTIMQMLGDEKGKAWIEENQKRLAEQKLTSRIARRKA